MTTLSPETGVSLAERTRSDFPILEQRTSEDSPLIYLDHAATSQKPQVVLDALKAYYFCDNANVHRLSLIHISEPTRPS